MSELLTTSPARVLQKVLIGLGVGSAPTGVASDVWPVYFGSEPDSGAPDNCITVFNTEGLLGPRRMADGQQHEYEGVQVRVRSRTHEEGWLKANAVAAALDTDVLDSTAAVDATAFHLADASRTSPVVSLGKERTVSARNIFTVNAVLTLLQLDFAADLEAYYRLTADRNDTSGNNRNLLNSGGVTFDADDGAAFNGSNYLERAFFGGGYITSGSITVSVWFNPNNVTLNQYLQFLGSVSAQQSISFGDSEGDLIEWRSSSSTPLPFTKVLTADYQHLMISNGSDGRVMVYYNGVLIGTGTNVPSYASSGRFRLGGDSSTPSYTGGMKHVAVYNRVLTAAHAKALYNGGIPFDPTA